MNRKRTRAVLAAVAAGATFIAIGSLTIINASAAVAGCRVAYSVPSQWNAGFTGNVTVTNLGDPLTSWRLTWAFPGSQQLTQSWNSTFTQSGAQVTVTNAAWNGNLATDGTASFGFNAAYSGSNPNPTSFALNGVACTGTTAPTAVPTTATPTPTTPGPTPTTPRPTTPAPTTPAPTTPGPTGSPVTGWNPPSNLSSALNAVWSHQESTYPDLYGFRNYIWDQIMAGRGNINYCVRWDSSAPVSVTLRDQIHAALVKQFAKWVAALQENGQGWNGFPYRQVNVKVVGWAVRDRSTLQWNDNSVDIYVNNIRENAPQCSEPCGRFFHQDGNYSGCPGGADHHYDMSLWLTAGMNGGAGGDWGQRIGSEYMVSAVNQENIHILLHEMGHGYGLDDFYDWDPGVGGFIMKAGSASQITEFDKWMLRDWWRHLKSRYGL